MGCHSLDGSRVVGPSFKGLYGTEGALDGGASYVADDDYIKRSILKPAEQIVAGFTPTMPPYAGQLSDDDLADIIAFIKSVK